MKYPITLPDPNVLMVQVHVDASRLDLGQAKRKFNPSGAKFLRRDIR